ncbi:MAG: DUF4202 domain-containing protein [Spirochaetales bacterium]|nr:DUF4202 domain-containing protein [Spirochaetales bacterium]
MVQEVPQEQGSGLDLERIYQRIDQENSQDPDKDGLSGQPAALLYGQRMTACLEELYPGSSPVLQTAVRAQHLRRFDIPRKQFPDGRAGYLSWRSYLLKYQASVLEKLLRSTGLSDDFISQAAALVRKENIREGEGQTLEDVACLVFLKHYLEDFSRTEEADRVISILRKTARRMSGKALDAAFTLELSRESEVLLRRALS